MKRVNYLFLLILVLNHVNCEKSSTDLESFENEKSQSTEVQETISPTNTIDFINVSDDIKTTINEKSKELAEINKAFKTKTPFGAVLTKKANIGKHEDGSVSYTVGLKNRKQELYFDNMLVQVDSAGNKKVNFIRYEPEFKWLELKGKKDRYTHYSGAISIYNEYGELDFKLSLDNGTITKTDSNSITNSCFFKVTYTVGCAYTCFISEIIIDTICVGGTGGGSGTTGGTGGVGGVGDGDTGGGGFGDPGGGSGGTVGTSPFDEYIEAYENDLAAFAEFEQDYRSQMSESEINIFDTLSLSQQTDYLRSAYDASNKANELYQTPCELHNGKGDAFRHAYWNALSSLKIGEFLTAQLTTAHEEKPHTYPYNSKESEMDLFNNNVGREIARQNHTDLALGVLNALNNGELKYLNNLAPSSSNCKATYNSDLIRTNQ